MEKMFYVLSLVLGLVGCGNTQQASNVADAPAAAPAEYCGVIYRAKTFPGDVEIHTKAGAQFRLTSENPEISSKLATIVAPNDAYMGCVMGTTTQGYEGEYIVVQKLELQGQATFKPENLVCGTVYRPKNPDGVSSAIDLRIRTASKQEWKLAAANEEIGKKFDTIVWPNDVYTACVIGEKVQGYEGGYIVVETLELRGQPTGFSVGN